MPEIRSRFKITGVPLKLTEGYAQNILSGNEAASYDSMKQVVLDNDNAY